MARLGINPARKANSSYQPAEVTVGMLTYIPSLEGYFRNRLEVLKLSISSLLSNTNTEFDFFVLDNGSCPDVTEYLRDLNSKGLIDYLLLSSQNLGVEGGVRVLAKSVLGRYFAFSNDDVFYYPGWLEEHLKIIKTFPNVGMVSGTPVGYSSEGADQSLQEFIRKDVPGLEVTTRERVKSWEIDWAKSTGRDIEQHLQKVKDTPHTMVQYRGVRAISSATHFQFVSPKEVIPQAIPYFWRKNLMDGMIEMDHEVDSMGFLRLSTVDRVTRHIGNTIDESLNEEMEKLGVDLDLSGTKARSKHWLLKIPGSGRVLRPLYNWLFKILHGVG